MYQFGKINALDTDTRKPAQMSAAEAKRRDNESRSLHDLALEGIYLTPDELAVRERVMLGEITEEEYRAMVREETLEMVQRFG